MNLKPFKYENNEFVSFGHNNFTLEDLGLRSGETIMIHKRVPPEIKRIPLLKNGEIVPRLKLVFGMWFDKHSTNGKMTIKNLAEFTTISVGIFPKIIKLILCLYRGQSGDKLHRSQGS